MAQPTSAEHARLGAALREIRKERELTIEGLAHRAKLNPRYLAGVERGEINVAVTNLLKIVAALGTSLEDASHRADL